jgi:thiosulfate/3-mercaptopyruvate sulfurtransferase
MHPLITAQELHDTLKVAPETIRLVDASYSLSANGQPPEYMFMMGRIGDAVFFDIDAVADQDNPLPHMVPTAEQFGRQVGAMGIGNNHKVVVYDQTGIIMAASRVWWMFRLFGHQNVVVLNGGLPAWKAVGYDLNKDMPVTPVLQNFTAIFDNTLYATMDQVEAVTENQSATIIDARPSSRYLGMAPEPRPNMNAGHIPTSHCVPASVLINTATGGLVDSDKLAALFAPLDLKPESPIITSCGSGVTACVDALALSILGFDKVAVYDGSWSEWGQIGSNKPFVKHSVTE